MTLNEAIKHAEEAAEDQEELYRLCPASESEFSHCDGTKDCKAVKNGKNKGCQKCAKEHRQLAEWLKDYKRLLEQEPVLDKIRAEIEGLTYYWCEVNPNSVIADVLQIIDKYKSESEEK